MDRWQNKVAVVTGASAGIGEGIARALVEDGLQVVGIARREDRLKKLSDELKSKRGKFHPVKVDVSKEEEIVKGFTWIKDNLGPVHILVNNAGIGRHTSLINGDVAKWREVLDTNVMGLNICTKEAVNSMLENKIDGHIIHINSVEGHTVSKFPSINVYAASKFAVTALRDTLANELKAVASRIKVTSLSPGFVKTEMVTGAIAAGIKIPPAILKAFNEKALLPEDIAEAVRYVLSTPPRVLIKELIIEPVEAIF